MARIIDFLRRIGAQPWLLPLTALLLRSRTVRQSPAFVARELCGSSGCFRRRRRFSSSSGGTKDDVGDGLEQRGGELAEGPALQVLSKNRFQIVRATRTSVPRFPPSLPPCYSLLPHC